MWQMECHAYGHDRWQTDCVQFLDVTQNLSKNVADVIPHCVKIMQIEPACDEDVMLSNYIMYAPLSNLRVTCTWLLTGHLLLDLNHARFSKDLQMSYVSPMVRRSHRKSTRPRVFEKFIP